MMLATTRPVNQPSKSVFTDR